MSDDYCKGSRDALVEAIQILLDMANTDNREYVFREIREHMARVEEKVRIKKFNDRWSRP